MPSSKPDTGKAVSLLQELVSGYAAHLEYYKNWLSLARQARARVDDADLDEFLRVHGEKEDVARRLREHELELKAGRDALREELGLEQFTLSELERARPGLPDADAFGAVLGEFRDLLTRLGAVMRDLEQVERDTESRLRRRLGALRGEIKGVHSVRRAAHAYHRADPDAKEARFIDHKG